MLARIESPEMRDDSDVALDDVAGISFLLILKSAQRFASWDTTPCLARFGTFAGVVISARLERRLFKFQQHAARYRMRGPMMT